MVRNGDAARCRRLQQYSTLYWLCLYWPFEWQVWVNSCRERVAWRTVKQGPYITLYVAWMYLFSMCFSTHHHTTYINGENTDLYKFPLSVMELFQCHHLYYIIQMLPMQVHTTLHPAVHQGSLAPSISALWVGDFDYNNLIKGTWWGWYPCCMLYNVVRGI